MGDAMPRAAAGAAPFTTPPPAGSTFTSRRRFVPQKESSRGLPLGISNGISDKRVTSRRLYSRVIGSAGLRHFSQNLAPLESPGFFREKKRRPVISPYHSVHLRTPHCAFRFFARFLDFCWWAPPGTGTPVPVLTRELFSLRRQRERSLVQCIRILAPRLSGQFTAAKLK